MVLLVGNPLSPLLLRVIVGTTVKSAGFSENFIYVSMCIRRNSMWKARFGLAGKYAVAEGWGKAFIVCASIVLMVHVSVSLVRASVSGPCSNCHTMHNSQDNAVVGDDQLRPTLLTTDCVGCHSSDASSTYYDMEGCKVPVVLFTGGEPTEYLAGGNFYWVKRGLGGDDTKGHNVFLGEDDTHLDKAPGAAITCGTNSCHENLSQPYGSAGMGGFPLKGKYGCSGCHLNVRHHAQDHPNGVSGAVTTAAQGWYRFLAGHKFTNAGVEGYEDGLWEAGLHDGENHSASDKHNEYLGKVDTQQGGAGGFGGDNGNTTTAFCTGCHGIFHSEQQDANAMWLRHPSDAIIPASGEYQYCTTYDPLTPVGRPVVPDSPSTSVVPGRDMVMCLSCHRPHGSPYADMLRWDYSVQISGEPSPSETHTGCFFCHTTKDDG